MHRLYQIAEQGKLLIPPRSTSATTRSRSRSSTTSTAAANRQAFDGLKRAMDVMLAGMVAVVCGYGDVGKGSAHSLRACWRARGRDRDRSDQRAAGRDGRLRGQHGRVDARPKGDDLRHDDRQQGRAGRSSTCKSMKDQAIVCNIGHFDNEIQVDPLNTLAAWPSAKINIKPQVDKWYLPMATRSSCSPKVASSTSAARRVHPSFNPCRTRSRTRRSRRSTCGRTSAQVRKDGLPPAEEARDEEVARLHLGKIGVGADQADRCAGCVSRRGRRAVQPKPKHCIAADRLARSSRRWKRNGCRKSARFVMRRMNLTPFSRHWVGEKDPDRLHPSPP